MRALGLERERRAASHISRRALLATGTTAIGALAVSWSRPLWPSGARAEPYRDFMRLSALLVPHRLDAVTGRRLATAMKADQSPMAGYVTTLLTLAAAKRASKVEDFFPFTTGAARAAALQIVSAWYLGVVEDVPGAVVFANVDALMFKPTSDVMTIPTYAPAGPSAWGGFSPPLAAMPSF